MARAIAVLSGPAFAAARPFARIARFLRDLLHTITDDYRPELHYMRGPGPACRAKLKRQG